MQESIYLILGCHGREEDGFTLCTCVQNKVLKIDENLNDIDNIWAYLEGIRLLDKPMIDINAIRNTIYSLQNKFDQKIKRIWSEKEFNAIERFIHMHKPCGLYLKLSMEVEDFVLEPTVEKKFAIKGVTIKQQEPIMVQKNRR